MDGYTNITESDYEDLVNIGMETGFEFTYRLWTAKLFYQLSKQSNMNDIIESSRVRNYVRFDLFRIYW